jgi:hypothetical protein
MTLSETARSRLADIVELQPTKNGELKERWDVDSGSDVHHYLENELKEYYYRDENSLIRATADAAELVDVEPGVTDGDDAAPTAVRVPELQARIVDVVPEPGADGKSVVAVLHALEDAYDVDTDTDAVRDGLQALKRKGVVEVVYTTVPTYRLAVDRERVEVNISDDERKRASQSETAADTGDDPTGSSDDDVIDGIMEEFEELESENGD